MGTKQDETMMHPETLRNIKAELKRARRDYPDRVKNLDVLNHYVQKMPLLLKSHNDGARNVQSIDVYANAIIIAVMAIRVAEEGASNFAYADHASVNIGPLFTSERASERERERDWPTCEDDMKREGS